MSRVAKLRALAACPAAAPAEAALALTLARRLERRAARAQVYVARPPAASRLDLRA